MIRKDYIMNQIEMLASTSAKLILGNKAGQEEIIIFNSQETGLNYDLEKELSLLLEERNLDKAENRLFEEIEKDTNLINLNTAVSFYNKLVKMDKETLKQGGFDQEEISEGFKGVCDIYEITDILF